MGEISTIPRATRLGRRVIVAALVGTVLLFLAAAFLAASHTLTKVLLTAVGVLIGALLANVQISSSRRLAKTLILGIAAILVSQTSFILLVWTGWKTQSLLWRLWWVSMVPSVYATHLLLLRRWTGTKRERLYRVASGSAVVAALLWLLLGFRSHLLAGLSVWIVAPAAIPAVCTVVCSIWLYVRCVRAEPAGAKLSWPAKIAILVVSHVLVLGVGMIVGRRSGPLRPAQPAASPLAHLSDAQVEAQIHGDLASLRTVSAGLDQLHVTMAITDVPLMSDTTRRRFRTFMSYRTALQRTAARYSGSHASRAADQQTRCVMLGQAATLVAYRSTLRLVHSSGASTPDFDAAAVQWGLPVGMYATLRGEVTSPHAMGLCEEMAAGFEANRDSWAETSGWSADDFKFLATQISGSIEEIRRTRLVGTDYEVASILERVRQDAYEPLYAVQKAVSEWMGDTRIVQRPPFVTPQRLREARAVLQPGDIVLTRRNWYVSNAFLPGFWPHGALYVGTVDDLKRLGIADTPDVKARLAEFTLPAPDGHANLVIEAISEGVVFSSAEHALHADYVAVLRPRLSDADKARAIARAFSHVGKPYDFEFDFSTTDKLVCTEVLYLAYDGMLDWPMQKVMGQDVLTAVQIVRKFAAARGREGRQLDFVLFLDAVPGKKDAPPSTAEALCESADRPRGFIE